MCFEDFAAYSQCADILEAQETLRLMTVEDWPHLKKDRRQKIHSKISVAAYPEQKKRSITHEELKKLFESGKL